ncbi:MAG: hypothetical protein K2Z80_32230 [Xanthobacteraceae bacterium]|nr:hypothetical protein [Xanthobacteraceae bacterium]
MRPNGGPSIAIIGAGLGGLVTAHLVLDAGFNATIYEESKTFTRLDAGIHLGPNVLKILQRPNVDRAIIAAGYEPDAWTSRNGITGVLLYRLPLRDVSRDLYGAPYVTLRLGDQHDIPVRTVPIDHIRLGKQLVGIEESPAGVSLGARSPTTHASSNSRASCRPTTSRPRTTRKRASPSTMVQNQTSAPRASARARANGWPRSSPPPFRRMNSRLRSSFRAG